MTFANPQYLLLLAAVPLAAAIVYWASRRRSAALSRIGDRHLLDRLVAGANAKGRLAKNLLAIAAIALAVIAIARPQWGETTQVVERRGVQLMVALDISRSMLAEDAKPNRLERAKLEIADLMSRLHGDEMGLTLFAGSAFVQFPLTFDYATARTFLDSAHPSMITRQGTAISEAIDISIRGLDSDRAGQKAILVITDGEDQEGYPILAAERAADAGIVVYTMSVGGSEGEPIPIRDAWGRLLDYREDRRGNMVISRVDEDALRKIAEAGGGKHIALGGGANAAARFAADLEELQEAVIEDEITNNKVERFQWFAGGAAALLFAARLIPETRRRRSPTRLLRSDA